MTPRHTVGRPSSSPSALRRAARGTAPPQLTPAMPPRALGGCWSRRRLRRRRRRRGAAAPGTRAPRRGPPARGGGSQRPPPPPPESPAAPTNHLMIVPPPPPVAPFRARWGPPRRPAASAGGTARACQTRQRTRREAAQQHPRQARPCSHEGRRNEGRNPSPRASEAPQCPERAAPFEPKKSPRRCAGGGGSACR